MNLRSFEPKSGWHKLTSAIVMVALGTLVAGSAAAKDGPPFKASGPWAINYGDQSCALIGNFTDGSKAITLAFERFLPEPKIRLGVAGVMREFSGTATVGFRYGPGGDKRQSAIYLTKLSDGRDSILLSDASLLELPKDQNDKNASDAPRYTDRRADELTAAAAVNQLTFTHGIVGSPEITLGPMKEPIRALQACTDDLMKHWKLDPAKLRSMSRQAKPTEDPQKWMNTGDYPPSMLAQMRGGVVSARLIVDEHGTVADCFTDIDVPTDFGKAACDALKKMARFEPALDADGKSMTTIYPIRVHFKLRD